MKLKKGGLDITLAGEILQFPKDIKFGETIIRAAKDLSPVLFAPAPDPDRIIYRVWKNVRKSEDEIYFRNLEARYDITVIYAKKIGRELPKTFGHYHLGIPYPEIYEVISGLAWFLIQRPKESNPGVIEEIYMIEAGPGEKIIVPPGFGHISTNPGKKELILANWVSRDIQYDYESYENMRGGGYYFLESKDGKIVEFEKNSYYEFLPEIIKLKPKKSPLDGVEKKIPMYNLVRSPQYLKFLTEENLQKSLTIKKCFEEI